MRVYTFGDKRKKSIMLIPGFMSHWDKTFHEIIPLLQKDYYVHVVSTTGLDEKDRSFYKSITDENIKIEEYIRKNLNGKIYMIYGTSLGANTLSHLVARNNIQITHAIMDNMKIKHIPVILAKIKGRMIATKYYNVIKKGKCPFCMKKKKGDYEFQYQERFNIGHGGLSFIKRQTIYREYYSPLITKLKKNSDTSTKVHILYSTKLGKKQKNKYEKYFSNLEIIENNLRREEYLLCKPKELVEIIKNIK